MGYFAVSLWRFDQSDEHYLFQIEIAHCCGCSRELAFPAVDKNDLRQRFLLVHCPPVAPKNRLIHRRKIIRTLNAADDKSSILCTRGFAVLKDDDAGDVFTARDV